MITYQDIKSGAVPAPDGGEGLSLALIQIDGGTQSRAALNQHVVDEYAEVIQAGATFPPIVVFYDGKKHWLADGFHRFHAYQKVGREKVAADVRQGTRRDAILHSVGANETHGLRRTRDDKRRAVLTLLNDSEWSNWTDRQIANACLVDHKTVAKVRSEVTGEIPSERTYVTKHGTTATMKTAGINASRKNALEPVEALSEVALPTTDEDTDLSGSGRASGTGTAGGEGSNPSGAPIPRNIVAEILALWNEASQSERDEVLAILSPAPEQMDAEGGTGANAGGGDVDRSATRASSAVEVGATNSPDGANAGETGMVPVTGRERPMLRPEAASTEARFETVSLHQFQSTVPAVEQAVAGDPQAPREPATATPFNNPRCQHPETCHLAHTRNECFDCNLAWAKRPKDEQVRLWAEAIQAARAA